MPEKRGRLSRRRKRTPVSENGYGNIIDVERRSPHSRLPGKKKKKGTFRNRRRGLKISTEQGREEREGTMPHGP